MILPFEPSENGDNVQPTNAEFNLRSVGVVRNSTHKPFLTADDSGIKMQGKIDAIREDIHKSYGIVSEIVVDADVASTLCGIDEYSHLIILYWAHKVPDESRLLTQVHPMGRSETPLMGIFSTCSPARPNPVLMCVVRLRGRDENVLRVTGLDAIDGSPVIDIKPYVKEFYPQKNVRVPEWMHRLCREVDS
jgi:tRNA-Thr(GGU) m(6)t(6)A37 methyltransferase TsaA